MLISGVIYVSVLTSEAQGMAIFALKWMTNTRLHLVIGLKYCHTSKAAGLGSVLVQHFYDGGSKKTKSS